MEKQEEESQKWERESYSNWQGHQDRRNETEMDRSERRSRSSRDNLIEAERVRTEGIKRDQERRGRDYQYRERERYSTPRTEYGRSGERERRIELETIARNRKKRKQMWKIHMGTTFILPR